MKDTEKMKFFTARMEDRKWFYLFPDKQRKYYYREVKKHKGHLSLGDEHGNLVYKYMDDLIRNSEPSLLKITHVILTETKVSFIEGQRVEHYYSVFEVDDGVISKRLKMFATLEQAKQFIELERSLNGLVE